jgi:hypothetical protein
MRADAESPTPDTELPKRRPALRLWVLGVALGLAALYGWLLWPSDREINPYDLSRADGKSRFYDTTGPRSEMPRNLGLPQRLRWTWTQYQWEHRKRNPSAYTFPAMPVQPISIEGLLNQCMEVTGTHYFIAVELAGSLEFGHTNSLSGTQWVAAVEKAIEASGPVICYDFAKKRNFQDRLVLIRERPGLVKVVPRTKLSDYEQAGLIRAGTSAKAQKL